MGAYKLLTEEKSYLKFLKESVTKRPLAEQKTQAKVSDEKVNENEREFDKMAARQSGKSDNPGPVKGSPSDAEARKAAYDKWIAQKKVKREEKNLDEKWAKEVDVKSTGENAGKSIAQLKKEIQALKGKPGNKEKMGKLLFALRAKQHWKKHTGA